MSLKDIEAAYIPKQSQGPVEVISIIFTSEDVYSMAEGNGIDPDLAMERANEWGKHIADTMTGYCSEQLESVIRFGAP